MSRLLRLRPRLLAALLATSLVTLGAAAIVLLPPLRDRLRDESVRSAAAATESQLAPINDALGRQDCGAVDDLMFFLSQQAAAEVFLVDNLEPRPVCGSDDPEAASDVLTR